MRPLIVRNRAPATRQAAFTLLEMVLALALFLGAITVLAQVAWNGQRAAIQSRLRTEAAFRCESKLSELLSGLEIFQTQQGIAFPDDPNWTWSATIIAGQYADLLHVKVTVNHRGRHPAANAEFSLERWTRDPSLFAAAAVNQSATGVSNVPTSSSTGSSSTQSSGGSR